MKPKRITTKITPGALRLLRLIAAATGERQYGAMERVLQAEWARLQVSTASNGADASPPRSDK